MCQDVGGDIFQGLGGINGDGAEGGHFIFEGLGPADELVGFFDALAEAMVALAAGDTGEHDVFGDIEVEDFGEELPGFVDVAGVAAEENRAGSIGEGAEELAQAVDFPDVAVAGPPSGVGALGVGDGLIIFVDEVTQSGGAVGFDRRVAFGYEIVRQGGLA